MAVTNVLDMNKGNNMPKNKLKLILLIVGIGIFVILLAIVLGTTLGGKYICT